MVVDAAKDEKITLYEFEAIREKAGRIKEKREVG